MMHTTVSFIVAATKGLLLTQGLPTEELVAGITWDSRDVTPGCAFVCLEGERVDGHEYLPVSIKAGARVCLVSKQPDPSVQTLADASSCALVLVEDTARAFRDLAAAYRQTLTAKVIGITGSCGKTTTKDMVFSVLSQSLKTVATKGNHNNELGVPRTVLSADADTEALVVEMGMRGTGQIRELCRYVCPSLGIITNIGVSHMELLGSQENIAHAKGELVAALQGEDACAVLCGDDPFTQMVIDDCARPDLPLIIYGFSERSTVRATDLLFDSRGYPTFNLILGSTPPLAVKLQIPGRHNIQNALASAALGYRMGLDPTDIVCGLEGFTPTAMRLEVIESSSGFTVINDAYNANPDSMRAALGTLVSMQASGKRVAVLGDMGELGVRAREFHYEMGTYAAQSDIELVICIGELAREIAQGAQTGGMSSDAIYLCDTCVQAVAVLEPLLEPGDIVLVKASRSMGLERVVKGLVK
jgi:UDP-N-acetylmuramoyl-tripeptide--D-alanyl-D-alanine ligase